MINWHVAKSEGRLSFLLTYWIIDLYFLIHAAIAQIFNPISELVISIVFPSKEAKAEVEIYRTIIEV